MATGKTMKTVTANVHGTESKTVRVAIPLILWNTTAGREISTGEKLCGWHRGRKWGVVRTYSIWSKRDGSVVGDIYTAYRLDIVADREAFERFVESYNPHYYEY